MPDTVQAGGAGPVGQDLRQRWSGLVPFRWLPREALDTRLALPLDGTPELVSPRPGSAGAGPERLRDSAAAWLTESPAIWPVIPFWPLIHDFVETATDSLADLVHRAVPGAPADRATCAAIARGFCAATLSHVHHLVAGAVATDVTGDLDAVAAADTDAGLMRTVLHRFGDRADAVAYWSRYQPLRRQVEHVFAVHSRSIVRLTLRLVRDRQVIAELLGGPPAALTRLTPVGDPHERGAVTELVFADDRALIHKPHSLALDQRLAAVFAEFDRAEPGCAPRIPPTVDCGDYGWQLRVAWRPVDSPAAVTRYFRQVGALTALAYAFRATDLHRENVLCQGGDLFVLDPECFFGTTFSTVADGRYEDGEVRGTVLAACILPQPVRRPGLDRAVDVSVLGWHDAPGADDPTHAVPRRGPDGTMRFARVPAAAPAPAHRPELDGEPRTVRGHESAVLDGFHRAYQWLLRSRARLVAPDGPVAGFAGVRARHVVRGTSFYSLFLRRLGSPEVAADPSAQEELVNTLWPTDGHDDEVARQVFEHEREVLLRGLIPTFDLVAGDRAVCLRSPDEDRGETRVEHAYPVSSVELVRQRIARLSETDEQLQARLIGHTFALAEDDNRRTSRNPAYSPVLAQTGVDVAELLDAAGDIAGVLTERMAHTGGQAWWPICSEVGDHRRRVLPSTGMLYNGAAGVALFAGFLDLLTGDRSGLAEQAELAMLDWADRLVGRMTAEQLGRHGQLGAFEGVWGAIYTAACLGAARGDESLLRWAERTVAATSAGIEELAGWDVISGSAGIAVIAAELHGRLGLPGCRGAAVDALEITGRQLEPVLEHGRLPTGVAHGLSGAALAFVRAARFGIGDAGEDYLAAAELVVRVEQSTFVDRRGGWHDGLGPDDGEWQAGKRESWCRGASGIGLVLTELAGHLDLTGVDVTARLAAAKELAMSRAIGTEHGLCHGALGAWELLTALGAAEAGPALAAILASGRTTGWLTGVADGLPDFGLMTGLAGIGTGLLRAAAPDRVPGVLTLRLPLGDFR